jgi:hypothetical protein
MADVDVKLGYLEVIAQIGLDCAVELLPLPGRRSHWLALDLELPGDDCDERFQERFLGLCSTPFGMTAYAIEASSISSKFFAARACGDRRSSSSPPRRSSGGIRR